MSDSYPTTIGGLLEAYETARVEHHALNKRADRLKHSWDREEVRRLKKLRCSEKTAMQTIASRLSSFPEAELRHELTQRQERLNPCGMADRHVTSGSVRERLEQDIVLLAAAIPESEAVRLVHSGTPVPAERTETELVEERHNVAASG